MCPDIRPGLHSANHSSDAFATRIVVVITRHRPLHSFPDLILGVVAAVARCIVSLIAHRIIRQRYPVLLRQAIRRRIHCEAVARHAASDIRRICYVNRPVAPPVIAELLREALPCPAHRRFHHLRHPVQRVVVVLIRPQHPRRDVIAAVHCVRHEMLHQPDIPVVVAQHRPGRGVIVIVIVRVAVIDSQRPAIPRPVRPLPVRWILNVIARAAIRAEPGIKHLPAPVVMHPVIERRGGPEGLADHLPSRTVFQFGGIVDISIANPGQPAEFAGKAGELPGTVVAVIDDASRRIGLGGDGPGQIVSPREIVRLPRGHIALRIKERKALPFAGRASERVVTGQHIGVPVGAIVAIPARVIADCVAQPAFAVGRCVIDQINSACPVSNGRVAKEKSNCDRQEPLSMIKYLEACTELNFASATAASERRKLELLY